MSLQAGDSVGPYKILGKIGEGGMGEVYRARDSKLDRYVAIKVLPEAVADNPERLARFEREAKVLASLNHPNIAAIYGVEERALVMELVEGETLSGPLSLGVALDYAQQIAAALEAAHEKGVVHRDLKPANIKVTPNGKVKVLDFGLAKAAAEPTSGSVSLSVSPTLTIAGSEQGVILGTAGYMSPEQARGHAVDKRADIWAFGVVFYEMLAGERLFEGPTVSDTLAAVLTKEPDWSKVPAKVRNLLRSCLEKDPKERLRDITDGWRLIDETPTPVIQKQRARLPWVLLAGALLAMGLLYFRRPVSEQPVLKLSVLPPAGRVSDPAISPDGRRIAFVTDVLWVRDLDSLEARRLAGTEGAQVPFWSPDSRYVAFFARGKLNKIDANGGPPVPLCDAGYPLGGSWSRNDVILFAPTPRSGLFRIASGGGDPVAVTTPDATETGHWFPSFLPDGRHFLYTASTLATASVYLGDLESKNRQRLISGVPNATYAPPGYLLFDQGSTLMAQPFNAPQGRTSGDPVPLAENVGTRGSGAFGHGQFAVSANGVLVYTLGGAGEVGQLTWFDRSGRVTGTVEVPALLGTAAISPDGSTIVFAAQDSQSGRSDIWLRDLARGAASRFSFTGNNSFPLWSPSGSHIAYLEVDKAKTTIVQKAAHGATTEEALEPQQSSPRKPEDWSRDGRYVTETSLSNARTGFDVWVLPLFGDRKPYPYLAEAFNEGGAKFSLDGRWLAYGSDETKRFEVYVVSFPNPAKKFQVSTAGGDVPVWSRDGHELYFLSPDGKMMAVAVKSGDEFETGPPQPLFDTHIQGTWFDVSKDGRFLIPTRTGPAGGPITVVFNWTAALLQK